MRYRRQGSGHLRLRGAACGWHVSPFRARGKQYLEVTVLTPDGTVLQQLLPSPSASTERALPSLSIDRDMRHRLKPRRASSTANPRPMPPEITAHGRSVPAPPYLRNKSCGLEQPTIKQSENPRDTGGEKKKGLQSSEPSLSLELFLLLLLLCQLRLLLQSLLPPPGHKLLRNQKKASRIHSMPWIAIRLRDIA